MLTQLHSKVCVNRMSPLPILGSLLFFSFLFMFKLTKHFYKPTVKVQIKCRILVTCTSYLGLKYCLCPIKNHNDTTLSFVCMGKKPIFGQLLCQVSCMDFKVIYCKGSSYLLYRLMRAGQFTCFTIAEYRVKF